MNEKYIDQLTRELIIADGRTWWTEQVFAVYRRQVMDVSNLAAEHPGDQLPKLVRWYVDLCPAPAGPPIDRVAWRDGLIAYLERTASWDRATRP